MSAIEEIKTHLSAADGESVTASTHRWEAARLIWETIKTGESQRSIAEQVGKSHTHIRYMYNCWEMVGRKLRVSGSEDLPDFQSVYNSDEVRGYKPKAEDKAVPEAKAEGSTPTTDREPREGTSTADRQPEEDSDRPRGASGLVSQAQKNIAELYDHRSYWQLLSGEDKINLEDIARKIRHMLDR